MERESFSVMTPGKKRITWGLAFIAAKKGQSFSRHSRNTRRSDSGNDSFPPGMALVVHGKLCFQLRAAIHAKPFIQFQNLAMAQAVLDGEIDFGTTGIPF